MREILLALCALADGATMSGKKDSLVNIGGWLGLRDPVLAEKARGLVVVYEGLHTYASRDQEPILRGVSLKAVSLDAKPTLPTPPRSPRSWIACNRIWPATAGRSCAGMWPARSRSSTLRA